jgi:hypothetical protein
MEVEEKRLRVVEQDTKIIQLPIALEKASMEEAELDHAMKRTDRRSW